MGRDVRHAWSRRDEAVRSRASSGPSEDQIPDCTSSSGCAPRTWKVAPWMHHSPNGGLRSPVTAARLSAIRCTQGFPDLALWVARGGHRGLAIELKASRAANQPSNSSVAGPHGGMGWIAVLCVDSMRHGRRSMTTSRIRITPVGLPAVWRTASRTRRENPAACWYMGRCDICRQDSSVTQVRGFGQLRSKLEEGEREHATHPPDRPRYGSGRHHPGRHQDHRGGAWYRRLRTRTPAGAGSPVDAQTRTIRI